MAKVTITLEDTPDGERKFTKDFHFDPPYNPLEPPTEVQRAAFDIDLHLSSILVGFDDTDIEDDEDEDELIDPTDTWVPNE